MTTTTIRTTCSCCALTFDVPSQSLVLALPRCTDSDAEPSFVHACPSCLRCEPIGLSWRQAAYLLDAGATALTAPDLERIAPRYPEQRPDVHGPMSLDDLIDLFYDLDLT